MDSTQFDRLNRLFIAHRTSRRSALVAGAGVMAAGLAPIAAQDVSPVPEPASSPISPNSTTPSFMFVQTLGAGSLAPKAGDDQVMVLTADQLAGQTLYFSDRPERIVGMAPTERFLGLQGTGGLDFTPTDPPNAALVLAATGDQPTDVVVLELMRPTYDATTGTVTYEVRVLDSVEDMDLQLEQKPLSVAEAARDFTAASLFIDDCANGTIVCSADGTPYGESDVMGFCYNSSDVCCAPCEAPAEGTWEAQCYAWYPDGCSGGCTVSYSEGWFQCSP